MPIKSKWNPAPPTIQDLFHASIGIPLFLSGHDSSTSPSLPSKQPWGLYSIDTSEERVEAIDVVQIVGLVSAVHRLLYTNF